VSARPDAKESMYFYVNKVISMSEHRAPIGGTIKRFTRFTVNTRLPFKNGNVDRDVISSRTTHSFHSTASLLYCSYGESIFCFCCYSSYLLISILVLENVAMLLLFARKK